MEYNRKIKTDLEATNKNYEILDSVLGQMSDGIWENSPVVEGYWRFATIEKSDDNKIVIAVSTIYGTNYHDNKCLKNRFADMTDDKVKAYFANKIKQIVKALASVKVKLVFKIALKRHQVGIHHGKHVIAAEHALYFFSRCGLVCQNVSFLQYLKDIRDVSVQIRITHKTSVVVVYIKGIVKVFCFQVFFYGCNIFRMQAVKKLVHTIVEDKFCQFWLIENSFVFVYILAKIRLNLHNIIKITAGHNNAFIKQIQ